MFMCRIPQDPLIEFTNNVKEALKGENTAQNIQKAVTVLLKHYGIER